ncbi:MAG: FmdB family zinc ribbon protein [Bacillota bacterium]
MPTYEYRCEACGTEFERFQSITAAPIKICPQCHKAKVKRLISAGAGLIFKGSGFYITDYRSDSYKKAAASESSANSGSNASSSANGKGAAASSSKPQAAPAAKAKT